MSKLDDLLVKKKTIAPILDLSRSLVQNSHEFKRLTEKVSEYKTHPIKIRSDEIKTKEKDFPFKISKKEINKLMKLNGERPPLYHYSDPIPNKMKGVVLQELSAVPIDWKMLTTLRPKLKIEEEFFSRMVEMAKLQLKTEARDRKEFMRNNGLRKLKNKIGIVETRIQTCNECGEELCYGKICTQFNYELFARVEPKQLKPKISSTASNKEKLNGPKKSNPNSSQNAKFKTKKRKSLKKIKQLTIQK